MLSFFDEVLSQVSNEQLQQLTDATASIFDGLYSSVGRKVDDVNDRTMLYLTMRFNRRIVQNALACKQDVENGKKLSVSRGLTTDGCSFSRSWLLMTILLLR